MREAYTPPGNSFGMQVLGAVTLAGAAAALNMSSSPQRSLEAASGSTPWPSRASGGGCRRRSLRAAGSGLGWLGRYHAETELLLLRVLVTAGVWRTLLRDWKARGAAYLVPYTHWSYLMLAVYAPLALAASCGAVATDGVGGCWGWLSRWAGRIQRWLFPVVATCHPFLDLGYAVFLHPRAAAQHRLGGAQLLLALDGSSLSKHCLNAFWVLAEVGASRMAVPLRSAALPLAVTAAYVGFAHVHYWRRRLWIYPPFERLAGRVAFPLATLPVWALVAQLARWRDAEKTLRDREVKTPPAAVGRTAWQRWRGRVTVGVARLALLVVALATPTVHASYPWRLGLMRRWRGPR